MTRKPGLQRAPQQRGQALILVLLVLSIGIGAVVFSFVNPTKPTLRGDQITTDALARAKAALIGYALRGGDCVPVPPATTCTPQNPQRPGEFPCPDTDNDGYDDGTCIAGRLGRIPWKTLGIPEPKDSAGETLWYAVAGPFRSYNSAKLNPSPINSNTRGTITVYAADGTTLLADGSTNQNPKAAVVVLFAPGPALGSQIRDSSSAACTTSPSSPVARNRCAANYLDVGPNNRNNATTNGPFIAGLPSPSFNDRVLFITTPEFMPAAEIRVAKEAKALLEGYRVNSTCLCYPWAETWPYSGGIADLGVNRGRFPGRPYPEDWGEGAIPNAPAWFLDNDWHNVIFYSVSRQRTNGGGAQCKFCSPSASLSVSGTPVDALFFTPGTPLGSINRESSTSARNNLVNYLEDAENNSGGHLDLTSVCPNPPELGNSTYTGLVPPVPLSCDQYVTPTSTAMDRDRITTLTLTQCAVNATALVQLAPCGQPPKLNPQCTAYSTNLLACSGCSAASVVMINPPCQNSVKPSACQAALATLRACS